MDRLKKQQGEPELEAAIVPVLVEPALGVALRKATGPRTPQGRARSKRNATKHGIFSTAVLLPAESRTEYDSLLKGLWESLQPEGRLEEALVEKLATLLWRQRRLILTEAAEIRKSVEFMEWDQQNQQREQAQEIGGFWGLLSRRGLIRLIRNPDVFDRCLELLAVLREGIERNGFQKEDSAILEIIYGDSDRVRLKTDLYDNYRLWSNAALASEEERKSRDYPSPEQCKQYVLQAIHQEIQHLQRDQKVQAAIEANRTKLEVLRRQVPESPSLDRLLRYEASLERAFDRTLSQLERLQRMRQGQFVPPTVKVELSS